MFSGERINFTEQRAVLHTALRAPVRPPLVVEGVDVEREVAKVLNRMQRFVESIHNGSWRGHTGKPIRDVVNIGIGGSDLGPAMVCHALDHYAVENVRVHFVSNLDPAHLFAGPDAVREEVAALLRSLGRRSRFILNLGHGILQLTPRESAIAFVDAAKRGWPS